jgi:CheY-like chemotaxis protein
MSAQPILVVDDSPVNLKLMRLMLTHEGFNVRTSERAEEALQMLDSFRPALVLTDIQMPGMDGIEMTRRIKSDQRTSAIRVAALTSSTSGKDCERALAAGCESCIMKSEDTAKLAAHVRGLLGETLLPQTTIEAAPNRPSLTPGSAILRRRFFEEAAQHCGALLESLDTRLDLLAIGAQLREWAGDGAHGLPTITALALQGEQLVAESPLRTAALRECLSDLYFSFQELLAEEGEPSPNSILRELRGKRVALIDLPTKSCDTICAALSHVEARPLVFSTGIDLDSQSIRDCDIIMLHVQAGMNAGPLQMLAAGAARLLLAGELRDLLEVAGSLPIAAAEFLTGNWEPDQVLMRLALAAKRCAAEPPKQALPQTPAPRPRESVSSPVVVLADDDPIVQTILRSLLTNYGMRCYTASDGIEALRLVREIQPHVAVLDIDMPGASGNEVLAALRADNMSTLVVMLSAHQQEADILRCFHLGADDFLIKPFNPAELVARLKRLLRQGVTVQ